MRKLVVNGEVVAVIQDTQQIVVVDDEELNLGDYLAGTLDSNMSFDGVKNYEWIRDKKGISMLLDLGAKVEKQPNTKSTRETLIYNLAVWLTTTQGWDTQDAKDALRCDFGISSEEVEEIFAEIK